MILVVDTFNLLYRAGYGFEQLTTPQGFPITALYGSIRILTGLLRKFNNVEQIVFCSDPIEHTPRYWRSATFPEYKANRKETPKNRRQELVRAMVQSNSKLFREFAKFINCVWFEDEEEEADDLLAWVAGNYRTNTPRLLVSGDRDIFQLVAYPNVELYYPEGQGLVIAKDNWPLHSMQFTTKPQADQKVPKKVDPIPLEHWVSFRALCGDKSDNIPGLDGVSIGYGSEIIREGAQLLGRESPYPWDHYAAWAHHWVLQDKPSKRRMNIIDANPDAETKLRRNWSLMFLDPARVPQSRSGFYGTTDLYTLEEWFRQLNFRSLVTGGEHYNQFRHGIERLRHA